MTEVEKLETALRAYDEAFGNLDELLHPALMEEEAFPSILRQAVEDRQPLNRAKLESVFGAISWDW